MTSSAVSRAFQTVLADLEPDQNEVAEDLVRIQRMVKAIGGGYVVSGALLMGSHRKGTAVRGVSDIDLFLQLERGSARWGKNVVSSKTVLSNCRAAVQLSLPYSTVRSDKVAVSVDIARAKHHIEVVPALFEGVADKFARFKIPDGDGGWVLTAPLAHASWLTKRHEASGNRLKPIVRLLKAWAASRGATRHLSSYYVESALGFANVVGGPWSHSESLYRAFDLLVRLDCQSIADPLGVSDAEVAIARTPEQCDAIADHVEKAHDLATQARDDEEAGREAAAVRRWKQIFNHQWF